MLVVGHDHGNMAVGSIVLSVVPIGKLIGTRKSEFAGTPPLTWYLSTKNGKFKFEGRGGSNRPYGWYLKIRDFWSTEDSLISDLS